MNFIKGLPSCIIDNTFNAVSILVLPASLLILKINIVPCGMVSYLDLAIRVSVELAHDKVVNRCGGEDGRV
jgi:hypothetical protein